MVPLTELGFAQVIINHQIISLFFFVNQNQLDIDRGYKHLDVMRLQHPRNNAVNDVMQSLKLPLTYLLLCWSLCCKQKGKKTARRAVFSSVLTVFLLWSKTLARQRSCRKVPFLCTFIVCMILWWVQGTISTIIRNFLKSLFLSLFTLLMSLLLLFNTRWSTSEGEWSKHHRESLLWGYILDPRQRWLSWTLCDAKRWGYTAAGKFLTLFHPF